MQFHKKLMAAPHLATAQNLDCSPPLLPRNFVFDLPDILAALPRTRLLSRTGLLPRNLAIASRHATAQFQRHICACYRAISRQQNPFCGLMHTAKCIPRPAVWPLNKNLATIRSAESGPDRPHAIGTIGKRTQSGYQSRLELPIGDSIPIGNW